MKRINNIQTKDYIAEAIRNEILSGNIDANEALTQESLAEVLGVSRMPIREALQTLVQEGFVERLPNRHMRVVALNQDQVKEFFQIVAAMEAQLVELLLTKKHNLSKIYKLFNVLKEEYTNGREVELKIHYAFTELLDNKYLISLHDKMFRGYISYAIEHLGEDSERKALLEQIGEAILYERISDMKKLFLDYYNYYAMQF